MGVPTLSDGGKERKSGGYYPSLSGQCFVLILKLQTNMLLLIQGLGHSALSGGPLLNPHRAGRCSRLLLPSSGVELAPPTPVFILAQQRKGVFGVAKRVSWERYVKLLEKFDCRLS